MATRSESSSALRTNLAPQRRRRVELDLYSITGERGAGVTTKIATLLRQARHRDRLAEEMQRATRKI